MKENVFTTKLFDVIISEEAQTDITKLKYVFLVMDLVDIDLRELFSIGSSSFGYKHTLVVMYNLLCAMNFLHTAGVIHRDLKPANILIDHNCTLRLCDFGLSVTDPRI